MTHPAIATLAQALDPESLKVTAMVVGVLVSAPMIFALIRAGIFFGTMNQSVTNLQQTFTDHIKRIEVYMERTDDTLNDHNGKLAVLWEGHERRKPAGR